MRPLVLKQEVVCPLLKKPSLDSTISDNFLFGFLTTCLGLTIQNNLMFSGNMTTSLLDPDSCIFHTNPTCRNVINKTVPGMGITGRKSFISLSSVFWPSRAEQGQVTSHAQKRVDMAADSFPGSLLCRPLTTTRQWYIQQVQLFFSWKNVIRTPAPL